MRYKSLACMKLELKAQWFLAAYQCYFGTCQHVIKLEFCINIKTTWNHPDSFSYFNADDAKWISSEKNLAL